MKTVYIAGPMRGYPQLNFPAFDRARDHLKNNGFDPISPADMDRESNVHEDDVRKDDGASVARACIRRDVDAICKCDMIALLPGWRHSRGARAEVAIAEFLSLPVYELYSKHLVCINQAAEKAPRMQELNEEVTLDAR